MSPVFRHGGLRLYLLKLLDEAPRHGYEVIRLLQDRFLGVYAPSPGTIYPRLARLEEDGLVTHDEVGGKKIYRITDRGRAEIHARLDDLTELEQDLSASVRDIAREVGRDVRDTVRSLRAQLRSEFRPGRQPWPDLAARREWARWEQWAEWQDRETWQWRGPRPGPRSDGRPGPFRELERLAVELAGELRVAVGQASDVGEGALSDLREILTDTIARIRTEVLRWSKENEIPPPTSPPESGG